MKIGPFDGVSVARFYGAQLFAPLFSIVAIVSIKHHLVNGFEAADTLGFVSSMFEFTMGFELVMAIVFSVAAMFLFLALAGCGWELSKEGYELVTTRTENRL
jgi:hypothetical protein